MTQIFNFFNEITGKYDQDLYFMIMDSFDRLPLVCIVNEKYFCVHGGISPEVVSVEEIYKMNRKVEIPTEGKLCDFLWSDPVVDKNGELEEG